MSDETLMQPAFPDDDCDTCAPTEREPAPSGPGLPARGAALSVLWWLEGEAHDGETDRGAS